MSYDDKSPFPHDGKHGRFGCGEGYSWDKNDYSSYRRGSSGGGNGGAIWLVLIIVCCIVGAFNEILAALIILIAGFILFVNR